MLLLELIEQYAPVYPEGADWQETARYLYDEEPDHMAILTASLQAEGWREPIRLSEAEELLEGERPLVLNGTHRVAIALREGVISVPVVSISELPEHEETPCTVLKFRITGGSVPTEEDEWDLFEVLRSFPLTDGLWVEAAVSSSSSENGDRVWSYVYEGLEDEDLHGKLRRKARSLLRAAYPELSFKITTEIELPAED